MKKVLSLVLALAMVLALAVPAFADTTITSPGAEIPPIEVIVPQTASYVLNPYKMTIYPMVDEDNDPETPDTPDTANQIGRDQIMCDDILIVNVGITNIQATVQATATPEGNAKLATKTLVGDTKTVTNSIFMQLKIGEVDKISYTPAVEDEDNPENSTPAAVAVDTANSGKVTYGDTALTLGTKAVTGTFKLNAPTGEGATKAYSGAALKLDGDAVSAPSTPWAKTDNVKVVLTYTFAPVA